jgi:hypothetical protein
MSAPGRSIVSVIGPPLLGCEEDIRSRYVAFFGGQGLADLLFGMFAAMKKGRVNVADTDRTGHRG